jgi:FKBP-type peptidyl-prolyl cis-trans isomerase
MNKKSIIISAIILILIAGAVYVILKPDAKPATELKQTDNKANQVQIQQNSLSYDIQGMKVEILKEGTGAEAKSGDKVTVNYVGTLENGKKFDSSIDRNQPFSFTLGENSVIQGWELGVAGMKIGEKRKLTIPPELGYGNQAVGGTIPANSTLVFEIDLLAIN